MTNEEIKRERELKILTVAKTFLKNPTVSMVELERITGISKSSCQRYLNDTKVLDPVTSKKIRELLKANKDLGRIKGGINSLK